MGARWYNGNIGRWISPDTIVPDPANPQSLNRYSYVRNNPLKYIDPTGHRECGPACLGEDTTWALQSLASSYRYESDIGRTQGWTEDDTEVVVWTLGAMALPELGWHALTTPDFFWSVFFAELGYLTGIAISGEQFDGTDALVTLYIGGMGGAGPQNKALSVLYTGVLGVGQDTVSSGVHGEPITLAGVGGAFGTGIVAGTLGELTDYILSGPVTENSGQFFVGLRSEVSSFLADTIVGLTELAVDNAQLTSPANPSSLNYSPCSTGFYAPGRWWMSPPGPQIAGPPVPNR